MAVQARHAAPRPAEELPEQEQEQAALSPDREVTVEALVTVEVDQQWQWQVRRHSAHGNAPDNSRTLGKVGGVELTPIGFRLEQDR